MVNLDDRIYANLNDQINNLEPPGRLPHKLPIAHTSNARQFSRICQQGHLEPSHCQVFNRQLLYFFYGGAFYRSSNIPTQDATQLPIAFLFDPQLLDRVVQCFPFDTGAAYRGRYGSSWSRKLQNFNIYSVSGSSETPCKLVYHIYESNTNYLRGNYSSRLQNQLEPLSSLYEFLNTDLTTVGCDHRKCIIECQVEQQVDLRDHLLWIAFPDSLTKEFLNLCQSLNPFVPEFEPYDSHLIYTPSQIEQELEAKAREIVKKRYVDLFETS